jgi:hypothetical protein
LLKQFAPAKPAVLLAMVLFGGLAHAEESLLTRTQLSNAVQRSLILLEGEGVAWMKERGCASCHHVPFLLWTHNEAKARGFPVDAGKFDGWLNWTLVNMLARGKDANTGTADGRIKGLRSKAIPSPRGRLYWH